MEDIIPNATDLGINLDHFEDTRSRPPGGIELLMGCRPWSGAEHERAEKGLAVCPVCGARELKRKEYCLGCDRFRLAAEKLPGEPVGSRLNEGWEAEPTKYRPNGKLRGGKK